MAQTKPLIIELTRDTASFPQGTQLGVEREADAARTYGENYTIVGYQNGEPYEPPAAPAAPAPPPPSEGA